MIAWLQSHWQNAALILAVAVAMRGIMAQTVETVAQPPSLSGSGYERRS